MSAAAVDQVRADRRRRADDVRSTYRVSSVVARRTKLLRAGSEMKGLCPFHQERSPSLFVNDAKGFYHCFGCGAHGDVIQFVMETERVGFVEALDLIDGGELPKVAPEEMARMRATDQMVDRQKAEAAHRFWLAAGPIRNTPADMYLWERGIITRPDTLRFGHVPAWQDQETGEWGPTMPALLLRAETLAGEFAGIQRIFLTDDGRKRPMRAPKRSLGNIRGSSIRFGHVRDWAILTGGPEDGLTLYERHGGWATVYVSCGEAMLPFVRLPSVTRRVVIARQNDKPGLVAAERAKEEFGQQGRGVSVIGPAAQFKDWNDELLGKVSEHA